MLGSPQLVQQGNCGSLFCWDLSPRLLWVGRFQRWIRERPDLADVADFSGVSRVEEQAVGTWFGIAPDGSVLVTRDIGTQEIYAVDVKWP